MTESKKKVKVPCKDRTTYDKELAIFKEETLQKIEEFRKARSEWVTSKNLGESVDNSEKKTHDSGLYMGRCALLRKLGFSTKRMRRHYKTLRPLRYYTLRMKVSEPELPSNEQTENKPSNKGTGFKFKGLSKKKKKETEDGKKNTEGEEQKTGGEMAHQEPVSKGADECSCEAILGDNKKGKKKGEKNKKMGPSKRAIENLKAAAQANRYVESCKCNDGKEMTVIIKGFCPCDNLNLNQLKLNKVCNKYMKSQKQQLDPLTEQEIEERPPAPEPPSESVAPAPDPPPEPHSAIHLTDSLTFHKKILAKKHLEGKGSDEKQPSPTMFPRAVSFGKVEVLEKEIEIEKKRSASITTIFKNHCRRKSHSSLTKEQRERLKAVSEEEKKRKCKGEGKK